MTSVTFRGDLLDGRVVQADCGDVVHRGSDAHSGKHDNADTVAMLVSEANWLLAHL